MARFDIYIPYLTNFEGGYVNDPLDRGGETNMGITLNTYKGYCKIVGKPYLYEQFRNMDISLRNEIIKKVFWDNCKADEIVNQSVAMAIACIHQNHPRRQSLGGGNGPTTSQKV